MPELKSQFLTTLSERGFIHQCTDLEGLDTLFAEKEKKGESLVAYIGFDCTAKSLHVGSLMQIMVLRWLQKCGHKPMVLMGGATTKIGDPTGKDEARKILSDAEIAANMAGIKSNFSAFLKFGTASSDALMVNNDDWLKDVNYIELLRMFGRHFSINRMLAMESVKLRLERESEMSFLEFNYLIMQAYDYEILNQKHQCRLQIGGSDQWGNIIGGVELHRRLAAEKNQGKINVYDHIYGLTTPLLTTASGAKMGKTEAGAVWLNAEMRSPYDYWQFWRNTEDADVGRFLKFFTELPLEEIKKLEAGNINDAKKRLATEATRLCHGEKAALEAAETARKTFEEGATAEGLPEISVPKTALNDGSLNPRTLLVQANLAESGGDAKKLIAGGGVKINDQTVSDPNLVITAAHLNADGVLKLSKGKKHHVIVKFQ